MQLAVPKLRAGTAFKSFNKQLAACDHDLDKWRRQCVLRLLAASPHLLEKGALLCCLSALCRPFLSTLVVEIEAGCDFFLGFGLRDSRKDWVGSLKQ